MNEEEARQVSEEYGKFLGYLASAPRIEELRERARRSVAPCPRDELYREHSVRVHRYRRSTPARFSTPLLVVPSLVNQPWIMDLLRGESFVEAMLARGFDVFMIEWGAPNPAQANLSLEHYLRRYLGRAVRRVLRTAGAEQLSLAGYCVGGTLSLLYAALDRGHQVRNLVTMVAPVDFEDAGMLAWWADRRHFDVDKVVDCFGNIPADFFANSFPWLVPTGGLRRARVVYEKQDDEDFLLGFLALDVWLKDQVPFPGQVYRELIRHGYQENRLATTGEWPLERGAARLVDLDCAVLNLAARDDHVAPAPACMALHQLVDLPDETSEECPTGHLGIALGKDARGRSTPVYWDRVAGWLAARDA